MSNEWQELQNKPKYVTDILRIVEILNQDIYEGSLFNIVSS